MTSETLLLIGRETAHAQEMLETHADRLARRGVVEEVDAVTYEREPVRELRSRLRSIPGDRVYVMPVCVAHTFETVRGLPAALSFVSGTVQYCEPVGWNPAITDVIVQRATDQIQAGPDVSLVLVGFGSSSKPYHRQMAEYHATRLREGTAYGDVHACYLVQDPAIECARYAISNDRAVAVPLFLTHCEATERRIPEQLEPTGIEYTDPLGTHPLVTDAIHAELEKQRVLAVGESTAFEARLTATQRPVATDGEGPD
ncbi:CbiX/SirB N-terminal domain-containing protein [Halocatena pleomorpha]|uniref:Sirohydrochlorin chelatase n=1 Tax=Halocatena pleomorpha TaxID=1785090 RepID=A0A3P3RLD1_9EURY|nr:CbiX/SirB N-terminal domain-containing protein [Halocatena pleomorpha]RRJ33698.1 sirohydrochlorin chelatase [Halocatena pleomorpha]